MSDYNNGGNKYLSLLREFSIPLLAGILTALVFANVNQEFYNQLVYETWSLFVMDGYHVNDYGGALSWHHYATVHFLANQVFMVVFFGVAAKEITEACLPGGALNPPSKAINPLLGTLGGFSDQLRMALTSCKSLCDMIEALVR